MQIVVEIIVTINAEVIANAAAIGCDGLVVRNTVEAEQLLQAVEFDVSDADGFFVSQPFVHILVVSIATLCRSFSCNKDQLNIVPLGNLGSLLLTALNGTTTAILLA